MMSQKSHISASVSIEDMLLVGRPASSSVQMSQSCALFSCLTKQVYCRRNEIPPLHVLSDLIHGATQGLQVLGVICIIVCHLLMMVESCRAE